MNNFFSDIHSGIYYKQNNKSTHILSKIFPSISYNISYRSMLKNTDIITYKLSTGFESLLGDLYLNNNERLYEILSLIEVK